MISRVLSIVFLFTLAACTGYAGQISPPPGVYYHRFISDVDGPEATWINPAALGYFKTVTLQYIGEYENERIFKNWAAVMTGDGVGIAYRKLDDFQKIEFEEYIFAAGKSFGLNAYLGISYRYIKKGPVQYNKRHYWNIGMIIRENPNFTMAAMLSNLNRNRVNGSKSEIEQKYSITANDPKQKFSISLEIDFTTSQSLSRASYTYGVNYRFLENLTAFFKWDNHSNIELGISVDLIEYFIGAQTRLNGEGRHLGTSLFGGSSFPKR
jgi:hypothetical protein